MAKPMIRPSIGVVDTKDFFKKLGKLTIAVRRKVIAGLQDHADQVFLQSQSQVPVKTGVLRASAIPPKARMDLRDGSFFAEIKYNRDYALEVHENTFITHKIGKAKYLSDPIKIQAPVMLTRIGRRIKEAL